MIRRSEIAYLPQLDGLRAFAVLLVIFYHAPSVSGLHWVAYLYSLKNALRLGPIGVDIFFVLSGFLITSILLKPNENPTSTRLLNFYFKRALRIFPIYYLSLAFCAAFAGLSADEAWSSAIFMENSHIIQSHGAISVFSHTWSLSVEEQFYLVWPFLIWQLNPSWGRRVTGTIAPLIAIGTAVCLAACLDEATSQWAIFAASPVRMISLSLGGYLAYRDRDGDLPSGALGSAAALGGASVLTVTKLWPAWLGELGAYHHVLWICGFAMLSFGIVATCLAHTGRVALVIQRVLSTAGLRYIGRISYGLYLYHYVIFWSLGMTFDDTSKYHEVGAGRMALALGLVGLAATGSYHLIEAPILRLRAFVGPGRKLTWPRHPAGVVASGGIHAPLDVMTDP